VIQQLALLGVGCLAIIDAEELADTNRNRYVTARHSDVVPGSAKVTIATRMVQDIDPIIEVIPIQDSLVSNDGFSAVVNSDYVFGCVDSEGVRLILNELAAAYERPYCDTASDVIPGDSPQFGGHVCVTTWQQPGCLMCRGLIDVQEAQADLSSPKAREDRAAIYGVNANVLGRSGPSVVTLNGVVASIATTEFMAGVTGLRAPKPVTMYYGHTGRVTLSNDPPTPNCYYCSEVRGQRANADVYRYVRAGVGSYLR
jgi:molybdopterin/thiamine biosynthesis adenylyltransferase